VNLKNVKKETFYKKLQQKFEEKKNTLGKTQSGGHLIVKNFFKIKNGLSPLGRDTIGCHLIIFETKVFFP